MNAIKTRTCFAAGLVCFSAVSALAQSASAPATEEVAIFKVNTRAVTTPSEGSDIKAGTETREELVTFRLGQRRFVRETVAAIAMYDFQRRRIIRLDAESKEYSDVSLYSDICFRALELQNRLGLRKMLAQVGDGAGSQAFGNRFEEATLFGIELPGLTDTAPSFEAKKQSAAAGAKFVLGSDDVVAEWQLSDQRIAGSSRHMWARALRYSCSIHPTIMSDLQAAESYPKALRFRAKNPPQLRSEEWKLDKVAKDEKVKDIRVPEGWKSSRPLGDGLRELLQAAPVRQPGDAESCRKAVSDFVEDALAKRAFVDAFLAAIEYGLQEGETDETMLRRIGEAAKDDPDFTALGAALRGPPTKDKLEKLNGIKAAGVKKAYLLDIFRGNTEHGLGDRASAEKHLMAVLKSNPRITGVYVDLGFLYLRMFQMQDAWMCWDTARKLCPGHPMLKKIDALEQKLEKDFPGWL